MRFNRVARSFLDQSTVFVGTFHLLCQIQRTVLSLIKGQNHGCLIQLLHRDHILLLPVDALPTNIQTYYTGNSSTNSRPFSLNILFRTCSLKSFFTKHTNLTFKILHVLDHAGCSCLVHCKLILLHAKLLHCLHKGFHCKEYNAEWKH